MSLDARWRDRITEGCDDIRRHQTASDDVRRRQMVSEGIRRHQMVSDLSCLHPFAHSPLLSALEKLSISLLLKYFPRISERANSPKRTNERTNERTDERTNERTSSGLNFRESQEPPAAHSSRGVDRTATVLGGSTGRKYRDQSRSALLTARRTSATLPRPAWPCPGPALALEVDIQGTSRSTSRGLQGRHPGTSRANSAEREISF